MSSKLDYPNPLKNHGKIYSLPPFRQFGAGPCNVSVEVANAMLFQPLSPVNKYFIKMMMDVKEMLKYVYQTNNPITFVGQTSGNGGNEMMVTNLADPGDTIVVATSGVWGKKVADMGRRYNLNVIEVSSEPGEVYSFEELEKLIIKHKPVTLFLTHGESSGGVLQPLHGLGKICQKYNCLLAVDAVVSLGVVPLLVDKWEIDAVNGGTQKGIGAPAGMTLMSFSPRAYKRILEKKSPPPYIFDVPALARVWQCLGSSVIEYHYTYGSPLLAAVRQALVEVCEEGLENVWERHQQCSDLFNSKIEKLGIKPFVEKIENRFCGVNCIVLPTDINLAAVMEYVIDFHEIECAPGIGPTRGAARIGFLGQNAKPHLVDYMIEALKNTIQYLRENKDSKYNALTLNVNLDLNK